MELLPDFIKLHCFLASSSSSFFLCQYTFYSYLCFHLLRASLYHLFISNGSKIPTFYIYASLFFYGKPETYPRQIEQIYRLCKTKSPKSCQIEHMHPTPIHRSSHRNLTIKWPNYCQIEHKLQVMQNYILKKW